MHGVLAILVWMWPMKLAAMIRAATDTVTLSSKHQSGTKSWMDWHWAESWDHFQHWIETTAGLSLARAWLLIEMFDGGGTEEAHWYCTLHRCHEYLKHQTLWQDPSLIMTNNGDARVCIEMCRIWTHYTQIVTHVTFCPLFIIHNIWALRS